MPALKRIFHPRHLIKTVAASGTPEVLDASTTLRMYGIQFIAQKAFGTDNTGNVTIQVNNGTVAVPSYADAMVLEPGQKETWPGSAFLEGFYTPLDFKIKVATNGDGVRVLYNTFASEEEA